VRHAILTGLLWGAGGYIGLWGAFVLSAVVTGVLRGLLHRAFVARLRSLASSGHFRACRLCAEPASHVTEYGARCFKHLLMGRSPKLGSLVTIPIERKTS
jgi:hypothetical protein